MEKLLLYEGTFCFEKRGINFAHGQMIGDCIQTGSEISFREYQAEAFKFYFSRDTNWTMVVRI